MSKLIDLVNELNNDLYENNPKICEEGIVYNYLTDGYSDIIKFLEINVYNSEYQEYDDNDELIEPNMESIKTEVRKLTLEIIKGLG